MRVYACSDVGKVRPINEDSYYLPQPGERKSLPFGGFCVKVFPR